jgi:Putative adhesin
MSHPVPARTVGGMSMRTLVAGSALVGLAGLLTLSGCRAIGQHFSDTRTESATITEIRIQGDSGSVQIDRGGSSTKIDRTVTYQDEKPSGRSDRVEGSVLVLNTNCAPRGCSVDYQVLVPASVKVTGSLDSGRIDVRSITTATLRTDSGRITVQDTTGDVTATTDSGRIDANTVKGRLNLQTNSGSVHTSGVGGTLVIQTDSGSVHADGVAGGQTTVRTQSGSVGVEVASEQDVKVTTDSGRIELTVPKGGAFRVDGRSDSGRVQINIPQTSTGHLVELSSDSGSIQVDEGSAAPVTPGASISPPPSTAPSAPSAPSPSVLRS